jgi:hypothetical protein
LIHDPGVSSLLHRSTPLLYAPAPTKAFHLIMKSLYYTRNIHLTHKMKLALLVSHLLVTGLAGFPIPPVPKRAQDSNGYGKISPKVMIINMVSIVVVF